MQNQKIFAGAAELVENWPRPSASIEWSVWNAALGWMVDATGCFPYKWPSSATSSAM